MTLKVSSSNIEILNSQGQSKFSATEPLLHQAGYESAILRLGYIPRVIGSDSFEPVRVFKLAQPLEENDIPVINITLLTSAYGEPSTSLLGVRQPGNTVIPIQVRAYGVSNTPTTDTLHLSFVLIDNEHVMASLYFYTYNLPNKPRPVNNAEGGVTNGYVEFRWEINKYRYITI